MAASATQNPPVKSESKSAKKKKSKAVETEASTAVQEVTPSNGAPESNSGDGVYESPYIKELYKSIRSVNKKITSASRVDNVIAENAGMTLDELVAARKINADQKAQVLKKPQLQASLAQLEEQIAQYKKFDQEYKTKAQAEKADLEKTFNERANKELEEAIAATRAEAEAASVELLHQNLLTLTKFLQLAAIRRSEEDKTDLEDSKALEGLLTEVYSGNDNAVSHMLKLMKGSTDTLKSPAGEELSVTYADIVKMIAEMPTAPLVEPELQEESQEPVTEAPTAEPTDEYPIQSDPTIVNAGLTELDAPGASAMTNGHAPSFETQGIPANAGIGDGAANAAAEANWDPSTEMSASQEWVEVPRDATETDTGTTATPAAPSNIQSWADEQPDSPGENTAAAPPNDGFQEIQRNRGGQNRGNYRGGRGGRGDGYRGRGSHRGDGYRGRGRGGGGPRGGRRSDES